MENIKNLPDITDEAALAHQLYAANAAKSFLDFINVLSQIIEKHGAGVLSEINRVE